MATKIYATARFAHRADIKENWLKYDPVLEKGEPAIVLDGADGESVKIGDGEHKFSELKYVRGPKGEKGDAGDVNVEVIYNPTSENAVSNKAIDDYLNGENGYLEKIVKKTDYATKSGAAGISRVGTSNGIYITSAGYLQTFPATNDDIEGKSQNYRPIVPANLDFAVYSSIKELVSALSTATSFEQLKTACENYLNSIS